MQGFWLRVEYIPFHSCWEWGGSTNKQGYGYFYRSRIQVYAHREAYKLTHGILPEKDSRGHRVLVRHRCDNPSCVRPEHLQLGTDADNVKDMVTRGRHHTYSQTHCKWGHEFTPENTYNYPGRRECRTCRRRRHKDHAGRKS